MSGWRWPAPTTAITEADGRGGSGSRPAGVFRDRANRAEHWIVMKGTAVVEKDGSQELVGENQSTYIPLGCRHRLSRWS